jgi:hypothetical protein
MKRITEQIIKSPAAAAPVLTGANLHIPITFLKEGPAKIVDEGLIAEVDQVVAKDGTVEIANLHFDSQHRSSSNKSVLLCLTPAFSNDIHRQPIMSPKTKGMIRPWIES